MAIHRFNDGAGARVARERGEDVKFGDALVVDSERVVGVACTYPFAVTAARGEFYEFCADEPISDPNVLLTLVNGIRAAVAEAERLGFAVNPSFSGYSQGSGPALKDSSPADGESWQVREGEEILFEGTLAECEGWIKEREPKKQVERVSWYDKSVSVYCR